jgi:RimJ/RimL family protein N-acetyltransferase
MTKPVVNVLIRDVVVADIPIFFEQQSDPDAHHMVAFIPPERKDEDIFYAHWTKLRADETVMKKTILFSGKVAGYLVCFERDGKRQVGYWIGRDFWGKGIATKALEKFIGFLEMRPLFGVCVKDNLASIRILEKCGFKLSHYEREFAKGRGVEVETAVLILN